MLQVMGRYYLIHQSLFFDYLCGVIGMMAAIFTVTWMQRNNEQLAMLAAGVSTHRAIRPVLVSSVIVSFLAMANQEIIMPRFAEELAKSHDDDGERTVHVSGRYDSRRHHDSRRGRRPSHQDDLARSTRRSRSRSSARFEYVKGQQATYIPPDHPTAPLKGGWLVRDATINPPLEDDMLTDEPRAARAASTTSADSRRLTSHRAKPDGASPRRRFRREPAATRRNGNRFTPHSEIPYLASLPPFPLVP